MTPMIDVVFQLIIFFIVTINMEQRVKKGIELAEGPHARLIKDPPSTTMIVEVDKYGWISIRGAQLKKSQLRDIVKRRFKYLGEFPVLVRGDRRARHRDIRAVMDICAAEGVASVKFAAIKERKQKRPW
jgi:biopolymer transport protein ExbD